MERALRNFVTAFFFASPIVFGPVAIPFLLAAIPIFGVRILGGLSFFEGTRLVFLVFGAAFISLGTFLLKWREIGWKKPDGRTYAVLAFALPFWFSSFANPGFPLKETATGETYSVLPFLSIFLIAASLSVLPKDLKERSVRAFILGFVTINLPLAIAQAFGFDPISDAFSFPWEPGRAYGALGNPNSLAFLAALCLPAVFSVFPKGRKRSSLVAGLVAICVLSASWSGTAVALAYLAYRYFGFLKAAATVLAVTVSFFAFSQHFQDKRMSV